MSSSRRCKWKHIFEYSAAHVCEILIKYSRVLITTELNVIQPVKRASRSADSPISCPPADRTTIEQRTYFLGNRSVLRRGGARGKWDWVGLAIIKGTEVTGRSIERKYSPKRTRLVTSALPRRMQRDLRGPVVFINDAAARLRPRGCDL